MTLDPALLDDAKRSLDHLRELVKLQSAYLNSSIENQEIVSHVKRSLISLINNDTTGFLSLAMLDRICSVVPDLEKLIELMQDEVCKPG